MLREAILNAVAWLRANPDKHINTKLARTKGQRAVDPMHPDAVCFCAYGRIMRELGYAQINQLDPDLHYDKVWTRNDANDPNAHANVLAYLEEQAMAL